MQLRLFLKGTKNQMVHFPFNKYVLSLKIGLIFCLFSQRPLIYVRLNPTSPCPPPLSETNPTRSPLISTIAGSCVANSAEIMGCWKTKGRAV